MHLSLDLHMVLVGHLQKTKKEVKNLRNRRLTMYLSKGTR